MTKYIKVRGARVNNLKNIDLDIPINQISCFFGASGSGKTSLAFHTLFSESKRRFLNSFPTYLKFFSDRPAPVDVDEISPVLPVFGLPQNNPVVGTRSNVSDIMHLTELFQNLSYHYAKELCPDHRREFEEYGVEDYMRGLLGKVGSSDIFHVLVSREDFIDFFSDSPFPSRSLKSKRTKKVSDFDESHQLWEVARFKAKSLKSLEEKLKPFIEKGIDLIVFDTSRKKLIDFKFKYGEFECPQVGCSHRSIGQRSPLHFSPYNALGACSTCGGFGETLEYDKEKLWDDNKTVAEGGVLFLNYKRFDGHKEELIKEMKKMKISTTKPIKELSSKFTDLLYTGSGAYPGFDAFFKYLERKRYKMHVRIFIRNIQVGKTCEDCHGSRLRGFSRQFFFQPDLQESLNDITKLTIGEVSEYFLKIDFKTKEGKKALKKINHILDTANGVGLGHLNLLRKAKSLSAGEYQRLLLLKYLSYEGVGSLFIFDEPSLGLSDNEKKELLKGFKKLVKQQNTVVLIDHSQFFQKSSDYLVEMGPGSGHLGGEVLFCGKASSYKWKKEKYTLKPILPKVRTWIEVDRPQVYGKEFSSFKLPVGEVTWVRGESGSGKSASLINVLANQLTYDLSGDYLNVVRGKAKKIKYKNKFDDIIVVDSNLTRYTSRSSVGSMTTFFPVLRKHFLKTTMAKSLGLKEGHFSYSSDLGQCPNCEGRGVTIVEMQFLEDIVLTCEDCKGKKLKSLYAGISDGIQTVDEAFSHPIAEVLKNMKLTPKYTRIAEYLRLLNLDYLSFNRPINSLSGGEKQRIYLLSRLQKDIQNSILFFENISFGLSAKELNQVSQFLQDLSKKNNTIVIIDQDHFFEKIASHQLKF